MAAKERMISYNVLMKHLDSCIKEGKGLFKSVCVAIKCFVEQMPPVDAAPVVHAHWEEWWPGDCALIMTGEEMLYRCSACDAKYPDVEGFKYCPHCAAKMDLEE